MNAQQPSQPKLETSTGSFGGPPPTAGGFGQPPGGFGGGSSGSAGGPQDPAGSPDRFASFYGGAPPPDMQPPQRSGGSNAGILIGLGCIGVLAVAVIGGAAGFLYLNAAPGDELRPEAEGSPLGEGNRWSDQAAAVPISADDPSWGSRTAPATLVVFTDFECSFCVRLAQSVSTVKTQYGPAQLRVVHKHFPLAMHKQAMAAHAAGEAVFRLGGSSAFWVFHDLAFANSEELTEPNLDGWAKQAGVDLDAYRTERSAAGGKVDADIETGKSLGITGTPTSFVNGVQIRGAQSVEQISKLIDEQLAAARAELARGTAPDRLYVELCNRNRREGATAAKEGSKKDKEPDDPNQVWKVPIGPEDPVKGPPTALVTIVEFSDFQCPFCAKVQPTIDRVLSTYSSKVRLVWKDNPLPMHPRADEAAELAREARAQKGDQGFWAAHDLLFQNQKELSETALLRHGNRLGLAAPAVRTALGTNKHRPAIDAGMNLASDLGARGTPTFFINGRKLKGAQPFERFRELVDEEIPKADQLLASGVAPTALYDKLIEKGRNPSGLEVVSVSPPHPGSPWRGAADARLVIQQFAEFQCPFCKRVEPTLDQVLSEYGDVVKIVWRHKPLPMHAQASLAAQAAQEAMAQQGNRGFWAFHAKLYAGQSEDDLKRPALERYATEIGLDVVRFKKALDSGTHQSFVDKDAQAAESAGIRGTPTFVVGPYLVKGAQSLSQFRRAIQAALRDAPR